MLAVELMFRNDRQVRIGRIPSVVHRDLRTAREVNREEDWKFMQKPLWTDTVTGVNRTHARSA
jgi:hypothetical protein